MPPSWERRFLAWDSGNRQEVKGSPQCLGRWGRGEHIWKGLQGLVRHKPGL